MAVSSHLTNSSTLLSTAPTPTNESLIHGAQFEEPLASKIFYSVIFSLTVLASLIGNTVVCKAASEFPSRKPLSYHLVTNLAAAEIIGTLCLPFMFFYQYLDYWPFGEFACKLVIPLQVLCMFVVTSTLAAIAFYRFVFIAVKPSVRTTTSRTKILLLGFLWLVPLVVAAPLFVFHKEEPGVGKGMYCNADFVLVYEITRFILSFGVPYLIMVASYSAVALKLKRHISHRKREAATELFEVGPTTEQTLVEEPAIQPQEITVITPETRRHKSSRMITDLENDLLKMIYAVILIFVVCYLPYQVHFLFIILNGYEEYPEAKKYRGLIVRYFFLLTSFPSALHPLCYGTMSKFYARFFARLVLCKRLE